MNETKIVNSGFGHELVQTSLFFLIEINHWQPTPSFRLHLFHGQPAYADWWRNRKPVGSYSTLAEAQEALDEIAGLVNAHTHFEVVTRSK